MRVERLAEIIEGSGVDIKKALDERLGNILNPLKKSSNFSPALGLWEQEGYKWRKQADTALEHPTEIGRKHAVSFRLWKPAMASEALHPHLI